MQSVIKAVLFALVLSLTAPVAARDYDVGLKA
jgi:hypothetical protein